MPLRAKLLGSKPELVSHMSTKKQPAEDPEDVVFGSLYDLRTIELNRPEKLNSLNGSMISKITPRLLEWEKSDMANVLVMKGAGPKAFCAGGDVAALAINNKQGEKGQARSAEYFAQEYALDHLIATLETPYIAFMDGITMGGGVGLSVHAPLRIATERTVFAMPETTIGFFPDVGASFFLPRLAGYIGTYLALTSDRLTGVNVFYSGIATHYMHSTNLPNLESRLAELRFRDYADMTERLELISRAIEEYTTGLPHDQPMLLVGELREAIDRCFGQNSISEIMAALEREQGSTQEWAQKTLDTLRQRSPTALHVTLMQQRVAPRWSIRQTFQREHQLAAQFMAHPDFTEGVSARLINKPPTKPAWQPATLEEVDPSSDAIRRFFESTGTKVPTLEFHNDRDFREYPYRQFGLPAEWDVQREVKAAKRSQRDLVNLFLGKMRSRLGVKEVVEEIVDRKTTKNADGIAVWKD